jgi:hypothetical protein
VTLPTTPCPFGQCEHTGNAHTRNHCTLCECEKAPVVIPPPAPPTPPPTDEEELHTCGQCGALTTDAAREKHADDHERTLNTLEALFRITQMLARRQYLFAQHLIDHTTPEDPQ